MTPTPTESPKQNFSESESESESVIEKELRNQIAVKVITTSDKVFRFYEPVTSFFTSINIKVDNTYYIR